jgi:ATP-dependent Clp protease protease subunit
MPGGDWVVLEIVVGFFDFFRRSPPNSEQFPRQELLDQRVIVIAGMIEEKESTEIIAQLLFLQHQDPELPIQLVIESPGGSVVGGMAINDAIDSLSAPVHTFCAHRADGMALILLASGWRGGRSAAKKARFSITLITMTSYQQDAGGELSRVRTLLAEHLASRTGRARELIERDLIVGRSFDTQVALEYGLLDHVTEPT